MSENLAFFRRCSYTEEHLDYVEQLEKAHGKRDGTPGKLVSIPNKDGIYCYYKGLCMAKIKAQSVQPFSSSARETAAAKDRNQLREEILKEDTMSGRGRLFCAEDKRRKILTAMDCSMQQDVERQSEQIIVANKVHILFLLTRTPCEGVRQSPAENLTRQHFERAKEDARKAKKAKGSDVEIWFCYEEKPEKVDFNKSVLTKI